MIYDFSLPSITDTKNLKKSFAKAKYVSQENLTKLDQVVGERAMFKQTAKAIASFKPNESVPDHVVGQIIAYSEQAAELETIFANNYPISKNWKWTPLFTNSKCLKFGKEIKYGVSGEIVMARFAAFAIQLKSVNAESYFIKSNFVHIEGENINADSHFSIIKQVDPVISKLKESIEVVLGKYTEALISLEHSADKSASHFQNFGTYTEEYIETKGISFEIAHLCLQINANIIHIEYLRRQADFDSIGRFAKSVVVQAEKLEAYLKPFASIADPALLEFCAISKRLYKAIALWSLLPSFVAKLKTQSYDKGENMNLLGAACVSSVNEIGRLHREIKQIPNIESSAYNPAVVHYFTRVIVSKSLEVTKVYAEIYKDATYDEKFFKNILESDYLSEGIKTSQTKSMAKYNKSGFSGTSVKY